MPLAWDLRGESLVSAFARLELTSHFDRYFYSESISRVARVSAALEVGMVSLVMTDRNDERAC